MNLNSVDYKSWWQSLQSLNSCTKVAIFSSKHIERDSGYTSNFMSGFEEFPDQRKHDDVEWMKANPTRSAIVWIDLALETLTMTFQKRF